MRTVSQETSASYQPVEGCPQWKGLRMSRKRNKQESRGTHPMQVAVWTIQFLGGLISVIQALGEYGPWA